MCMTPAQEKILVGWIGGKDSSMAQYVIQKSLHEAAPEPAR